MISPQTQSQLNKFYENQGVKAVTLGPPAKRLFSISFYKARGSHILAKRPNLKAYTGIYIAKRSHNSEKRSNLSQSFI